MDIMTPATSRTAIHREERIGGQRLILGDCLEVMPELGRFDAVVTDPPYGINFAGQPTKWQRRAGSVAKSWDEKTPDCRALLDFSFVAIWGGNYFALPPSRGWLSWFKPDAPPSMAQVELCWTNQDRNARQISQSISATNAERVGHPTQKPLNVMVWTIERFPPNAETILDPFMGSGTTLVACQKLGRRGTGIEIDPDYFEIACKRVDEATRQPDMFIEQPDPPKQEAMDL